MAIRFGYWSMTPGTQPGSRTGRPMSIHTGWCVAGARRERQVPCLRTAAQCPFHLYSTQRLWRRPQAIIVDITHLAWEMQRLQQLGVTIQNPVALGLNGLVNLCRGRRVTSIDTALIHLCAAMGHVADLLLPRFPDERWVELSHLQHSYGRHLSIHRSTQFGSWTSVIDSLC